MSSYNNKPSFESSEIEFNVIRRLGVLAKYNTGWAKEVNIISWNKGANKLDIRDWDPDHLHMSKGITLYEEEAERLLKVLKTQFEEEREGTAVIGRGWDTAKVSKAYAETEEISAKELDERTKLSEEALKEEMRQEEEAAFAAMTREAVRKNEARNNESEEEPCEEIADAV